VVLTTADQPLGGELRVHPPSGVSVSTEFTLSCYYWTATSREELPLYFRFQVRTLAAGARELVQSLGRQSRDFEVSRVLFPRSLLPYVTAEAIIIGGGTDVYETARVQVQVVPPNRTDSIEYLAQKAGADIDRAAMLQDWYSFLDIAILTGTELLEQMDFENEQFREYGNLSTANFSRLYRGLSNSEYMSGGGLRRQQTAPQVAHEPGFHEPRDVERRLQGLLAANKSLIQTEQLGQQVRGEQGRGRQRRLLVAKESLIAGMQMTMLGKVVRYAPNVVGGGSTRVLLAKLALAMELLTQDVTQSTPEMHRDLVNVVRQTVTRALLI
jgi:hypothetical protein